MSMVYVSFFQIILTNATMKVYLVTFIVISKAMSIFARIHCNATVGRDIENIEIYFL